MNSKVTVIDYGLGNLFSVKRALEYCGAQNVVISSNHDDLADADHVVLPGVGAFSDGMRGLKGRCLVDPIHRYAAAGRPLLGICLGMQMLVTLSEEFGLWDGLDLIPGRVVPISRKRFDGSQRKIPNIGWNKLNINNDIRPYLFEGFDEDDSVYLVHSYQVNPSNPDNIICTYNFDGLDVVAGIGLNNIFGVQFHPEKSGEAGMSILRRFLLI